jgi:hypothetical protein
VAEKTVIAGSVKVQVYKAHRNQMDNQRRRVFYTAVPQASFVSFDPSALKPYDNSAVLAKLYESAKNAAMSAVSSLTASASVKNPPRLWWLTRSWRVDDDISQNIHWTQQHNENG